MSSSVLLEGSVEDYQTEQPKWKGLWKFIKDKKAHLDFKYSKVSQEVPRDLYEYVSFIDAATVAAQSNATGKGSHSKNKKRGRGRPPMALISPVAGVGSGDSLPAVKSEPTTEGADVRTVVITANSDTNNNSSQQLIEQMESPLDDTANSSSTDNAHTKPETDATNRVAIPALDTEGATIDGEIDDDDNDGEVSNNATPLIIDCSRHPLLGVWQGSFAVKTVKGDEHIPETLFFYSTLGAPIFSQFPDLPPEPQFPYSTLGKSNAKTHAASSSVAVPSALTESNETEAIPMDISTDEVDADRLTTVETVNTIVSSVNTSGAGGQVKEHDVLNAEVTVGEENNNINNNALTTTSAYQQQLREQLQSDDSNVFNAAQVSLAYDGYSPQALTSLYASVLIGFGRNPFGRFSVAALYDETTGELRCEKKYMTTKYPIKRGRKSYVECAMTAGGGGGTNNGLLSINSLSSPTGVAPPSIIEPRQPSVRNKSSSFSVHSLLDPSVPTPHHQYTSITNSVPATTPGGTETLINSRQHRQSKPNQFFFQSTTTTSSSAAAAAESDDAASALHDDANGYGKGSKRQKRSLSFSNLQSTISPKEASSSTSGKGSSGSTVVPSSSSGKHNKGAGTSSSKKEKAHQNPKETLEQMLISHPNAIIGPRNPDNDDPHSEYREAFHDVDTGEIYEGQYSFGYRNGQGICLYTDGLLYQGMWYKGREHGHGELMTGNRRVIYEGEWVEGYFHGRGTYYFGNGDTYSGDWKEGVRHGHGEYYFKQHDCLYQGDWRDNKRHGKGIFTWADGSFYEGDWEQDQRHGRGVLELTTGFRYDGLWNRNVMEGRGNAHFPNGQLYEGAFKNGLREGRGSVTFAEGAVYEGRFREDRFDGHGTIKINKPVPGVNIEQDVLIPVSIKSEMWRIHWRAGFGASSH